MTLFRIAVRVPAADVERARAVLLDLVRSGFEEIETADAVEIAAYGDAALVESIRHAFGDVTVTSVEPGWEERWRAFHQPVTVAGIWIGPPWREAPPGQPNVVIDPGRAFGTGAHPTTRLCVELLGELRGGSLLDVGCGSGVLSIAASRLGFGPVIAVDDDPVAIDVTRDNAIRNGVVVDARLVDAAVGDLPSSDVVVANVNLATVRDVLRRVTAAHVVTSGYLEADAPGNGAWQRAESRTAGGWRADLFRRT